jgi:DNA repair protein RadD
MRVHPGKAECRVLDFGGNIFRHGPINDITLRKAGERHEAERAAARIRICSRCEEVNAVAAIVCSCCGTRLVKSNDEKLDAVESALEVIGGDKQNRARVLGMQGHVHHKPASPPSFRLIYHTDCGLVSDFLAFQHPRLGARWYAGNKWRQLSGAPQLPPPVSAQEAEARFRLGELRQPVRVLVERDGEWWRIKAAEFAA